jgi:hypothetical protein
MNNSTPTPEELQTLRSGDIIDKLVIIKRYHNKPSASLIQAMLTTLGQGYEEIIEAIAQCFATFNNEIISILMTEIYNPNCFIRWGITRTIELGYNPAWDKEQLINLLIPAIGMGYAPTQDQICKTLAFLKPSRFSKPNLEDVMAILTDQEKTQILKHSVKLLGTSALDITETLAAIQLMEKIKLPIEIVPLFKAVHHSDYRVQQNVRRLLDTFSERTIFDECREVMTNKQEFTRMYDFNLPQDQGGENYPLYYYALEGMGTVNRVDAHRQLLAYLKRGEPNEKMFALRGLELALRKDPSPTLSRSIQMHIEGLLGVSTDRATQLSIIRSLSHIRESWAFSALTFYLKDPNPSIRLTAVEALNQITTTPDSLNNISFLLIDPDASVRRSAVNLYWKIEPGKYFGYNEGDIINKLSPPMREELLQTLTDQVLNTTNEELKLFGIFWLGLLRFEPAYPTIIHLLSHHSEEVVAAALTALGLFGNRADLSKLIPYIYSPKRIVSRKAIEAIGSMGMDGLYVLIHQLYLRDLQNPPFLESFVMSFGGRIINLLYQEIDQEPKTLRKKQLQLFCDTVEQKYRVRTGEDSSDLGNIML